MNKARNDVKQAGAGPARVSEAPVLASSEQGTIADARRAPMVDPTQLHRPPATYQPLDKDSILGLSKIAGTQEAELDLAVRQVIAQGPSLKSRFGELAPDTTDLRALWTRYQASNAAYQNAEAQSAYFGDISLVAANDILQILAIVDDTIRPAAARNAALAEEFSAVLAISDQRGNVVREGRLRAKSDRSAASGDAPTSGEAPPPTAAR